MSNAETTAGHTPAPPVTPKVVAAVYPRLDRRPGGLWEASQATPVARLPDELDLATLPAPPYELGDPVDYCMYGGKGRWPAVIHRAWYRETTVYEGDDPATLLAKYLNPANCGYVVRHNGFHQDFKPPECLTRPGQVFEYWTEEAKAARYREYEEWVAAHPEKEAQARQREGD